jgi:pyruvate,orthophosphate dikinase
MTPELTDPCGVLVESDALRRNMAETAVGQVAIDPRYRVLQEVVEEYRGLQRTVESLLFELNHPFRNWRVILPELRSFALKNINSYGRHPRACEAVEVILDVFVEALSTGRKADLQGMAADYLLAFLEKLLDLASGGGGIGLPAVIERCLARMLALPEEPFRCLSRRCHSLKRVGRGLLMIPLGGVDLGALNRLLVRSHRITYEDWMREEDPADWFRREFGQDPWEAGEAGRALADVSHARFVGYLAELGRTEEAPTDPAFTERLLGLPGHLEIVHRYRELPDRLAAFHAAPAAGDGPFSDGKVLFLFKIAETPILAEIHEESLREIQRCLIRMIRSEPAERLEAFLLRTFSLLKENVLHFPRTALQCIHAIGQEVFRKGQPLQVEMFLEQAVHFGFQTPDVTGVDAEWQWLGNPAHLLNVRVWLDLICLNPKWCTTLLSALIINLKLAGTCIRDTDLLQKDISKLLDSPIEPLYNLVKQLTKLIPAFFNEIGAEGLLREVSTDVDEIYLRKDPLVHFLRKQSHVESSNLIVEFIEEILRFWLTRDKEGLRRFLPPETFSRVDPDSDLVRAPHAVLGHMLAGRPVGHIRDLLNLEEGEAERWVQGAPASEAERRRVLLLLRMYRLVYQKYYLGFQEIRYHLSQAKAHGFPDLDALEAALEGGDTEACLEAILGYLERLKGVILSPERFEVTEDIYHKRHIAADIPSIYGRYHERKFDALGLSFRLENLANVFFERLIESVSLSLITRATFFRITRCLRLFIRAMQIDGISSQRLDAYVNLLENSLEIRRFTYTQYLDILRGLAEGVKDILNVYYTDVHKDNLSLIVDQLGRRRILPTFVGHGGDEAPEAFTHRISERFLRDLVSSTFGLQYLDNFLTRIHQTLVRQKETLSEEALDLLMTYDPEKVVCPIHCPNRLTRDPIHLGSKGYNLVLLAADGIPVPQGFIITTEVSRCHSIVLGFPQAHRDFLAQLRGRVAELQEATGRGFGDPADPLLVSVRSGATISMPGMMDTLLNVGINEEVVEGLARAWGNPWFAWDNHRRFLQSWGMSFGIPREAFNEIMRAWKERHGVAQKREFSGDQMCRMALAYRGLLEERGVELRDDPWWQLEVAVHQVIRSWEARKARDYREIMGISDDWGTAVIVQAMVFGNLGPQAGSGVLFTANPTKRMRRVVLWGDYTSMNQGEDIVAGLVATHPISREQARLSGREGEVTLEEEFPEVYGTMDKIGKRLVYGKGWNPQEIEFTFEGPKGEQLFILQTRDMVTARPRETLPVFEPSAELHGQYLAKGTGVSGGALWGRAVFTLEEIQRLRGDDPGAPLILIRSDTVPDDVKEISRSDGLLTAKGGQTSHAAIVALRLGKTCVVGCSSLVLLSDRGPCRIHDTLVRSGEFLSIDGRSGSVYLGRHPVQRAAGGRP